MKGHELLLCCVERFIDRFINKQYKPGVKFKQGDVEDSPDFSKW